MIYFPTALILDARLAIRRLESQPIVGLTVACTLALAIGGTLAVFAFVNALLNSPLSVSEPHRLKILAYQDSSGVVLSDFSWSFAELVQRHSNCFEGVIARGQREVDIDRDGTNVGATVEFVSDEYFRVLRLKPVLGRLLGSANDFNTSIVPPAVISYRTWTEAFERRRDVIGSVIVLDQVRVQVVGVAPDRFNGTSAGELHALFLPLQAATQFGALDKDRSIWLQILGKSKQSMTTQATGSCLERELPQIADGTVHQKPKSGKFIVTEGARGIERLRGKFEQPGMYLILATGLIFVLVCLNLATLLATVSHARAGEVAIRTSLGASSFRLVRQLFVECATYCLMGGVAGLMIGYWFLRLLVGFLVVNRVSVALDISFDLSLLAIAIILSMVASLFLTLLPTLLISRNASIHQLANLGHAQRSRTFTYGRSVMVIAQVSLSMLLLTTGLLFTRSVQNLRSVNVGFQLEGLGSMSIDLRKVAVEGPAREAIVSQLSRSLLEVPGVDSVATSMQGLLSKQVSMIGVAVAGAKAEGALLHRIGPRYFKTLRTKLQNGREFEQSDNSSSPPVAIINSAFRRRYFSGANPLGHIVEADGVRQVVGIVDDVFFTSLRGDVQPTIYLPLSQSPQFWESNRPLEIQIRSTRPEDALQTMLSASRRIKEIESLVTIKDISSLYQRREALIVVERTLAAVTTIFAGFACVVALLGLISLVGYNVLLRRHEIAIRMSQGASATSISWLFFRGVLSLVSAGIFIGYMFSILGWNVFRTYMFGVLPNDIGIPAVIGIGQLVFALLATAIPVRDAVKVSPLETLRRA